MQTSLDLLDPPPPYEAHAETALCSLDTNFGAWPSDYYRKTPRIDLEQFYHEVLQASTHRHNRRSDSYSSTQTDETLDSQESQPRKQVTFCPKPPVVYHYPPEYDEVQKHTGFKFDEGWPGRAKTAVVSSGFLDFKSKIEARLSAVNDASVMSQLSTTTADLAPTLPNYHPKGFLDFRPVLNQPQLPQQDISPSVSTHTASNKWLDTLSKLKKKS